MWPDTVDKIWKYYKKALYSLDKIINCYNLSMFSERTKLIAIYGKQPIRGTIVLTNYVIEQMKIFKYIGCD